MPPRICIFGGEAHQESINVACLGTRSGKVYATASPDRILMLWSVSEKFPILKFGDFKAPVSALSFTHMEDQILFGTKDGYLSMLDLEENKTVMSWSTEEDEISTVAIHPNSSNFIATGDVNGRVKIYSSDYQAPIQQFFAHKEKINEIKFSPEGSFLATCSDDGEVQIFDVASGRIYACFRENCAVKSFDFHPTMQIISAVCIDKSIHLYNLTDEETVSAFTMGRGEPRQIKFSQDGSTFASFSPTTISLFSTKNIDMVDHYLTPLDSLLAANLFNEGVETIHGGNKYPALNFFDSKVFRLIKPPPAPIKRAASVESTSENVKETKKKTKKKPKSSDEHGDVKKATSIYKKFRSSRATFLATISRRQNANERICEIIRNKGIKGLVKDVSNNGECAIETLQLLESYHGLSIPDICLYIIGIARFCVHEDPKLAFNAVRAALSSGAKLDSNVESMMRDIAPKIAEFASKDGKASTIAKDIMNRWPQLIK